VDFSNIDFVLFSEAKGALMLRAVGKCPRVFSPASPKIAKVLVSLYGYSITVSNKMAVSLCMPLINGGTRTFVPYSTFLTPPLAIIPF
jgi:hypothetical protein